VFNALRSDELLLGVGRVLRLVASAPGALEEYERGQALSAYSVTRLLAAEQRAAAGLLADTKQALLAAIGDDQRPAVRADADRLRAATDGTEVGDAVADLLGALDRAEPMRRRIHAALANMIDAEVSALADVRR
jgi:hypothetical protein